MMRRKEDEEKIAERNATRVAKAVGEMSNEERQLTLDEASNITFYEVTARLRKMDKIATKDKWTDQEFEDMVKFSALLYTFVVLCREFNKRFGSKNPLDGININIFKLGG